MTTEKRFNLALLREQRRIEAMRSVAVVRHELKELSNGGLGGVTGLQVTIESLRNYFGSLSPLSDEAMADLVRGALDYLGALANGYRKADWDRCFSQLAILEDFFVGGEEPPAREVKPGEDPYAYDDEDPYGTVRRLVDANSPTFFKDLKEKLQAKTLGGPVQTPPATGQKNLIATEISVDLSREEVEGSLLAELEDDWPAYFSLENGDGLATQIDTALLRLERDLEFERERANGHLGDLIRLNRELELAFSANEGRAAVERIRKDLQALLDIEIDNEGDRRLERAKAAKEVRERVARRESEPKPEPS